MTHPRPDKLIDAKGFLCPLPSLIVQKELRSMNSGEIIAIETTDQKSKTDIPHLCVQHNHDYLHCYDHETVFIHLIKKG